MSAQPARARLCRCDRPLIEGDTCLRCGRGSGAEIGEPLFENIRGRSTASWTRRGVVRAFRAFAFFRGRPPIAEDWGRRMGSDWPALETVEDLFGSLEAATAAAGLPRGVPLREYGKESSLGRRHPRAAG